MDGLSFDEFEDRKLSELYDRNFANARDLATGWRDLEFPKALGRGGASGRHYPLGYSDDAPSAVQDRSRNARPALGGRRGTNETPGRYAVEDSRGGGGAMAALPPARSQARGQLHATSNTRQPQVRDTDAGQFLEQINMTQHIDQDRRPVVRNDTTGGAATRNKPLPNRNSSSWKPSNELRALGNVSARPAPVSARPVAAAASSGGGEKGAFVGWKSN
ncbi:unnamed protein product [Amoebophrya sp. A120]|nr:unnamed protein product [Amoebophrya sp. A120]|eukprot:GSA120T00011715001.1